MLILMSFAQRKYAIISNIINKNETELSYQGDEENEITPRLTLPEAAECSSGLRLRHFFLDQ